ncbi:MAG TPA: DUF6259 domain-containing protein [Chthonomonadales bacterium]|nr:DUF6259 domain-containing protein [Chthonomonadales bacterium]
MLSFALVALGTGPAASVQPAASAEFVVRVRGAAPYGVALAQADLAGQLGPRARGPLRLTARDRAGRAVDAQYVPPPRAGQPGWIVLRASAGAGERVYRVRASVGAAERPLREPLVVAGGTYRLTFDPARMAGMPSRVQFMGQEAPFERFVWNDRVHHASDGSFFLRHDRQARAAVVSDGPLCTVVRVRARYLSEDGRAPASRPQAVVDWWVFRNAPLVRAAAEIWQARPREWAELHFLEWNYPDDRFGRWALGEPARTGELTGSGQTHTGPTWGCVTDGRTGVGIVGTPVLVHDGRGAYGTYLHGPWVAWSGTETRFSAWLWAGQAADVPSEVSRAVRQLAAGPTASVMSAAKDARLAAARRVVGRLRGLARRDARWRLALAERLALSGRDGEAGALVAGRPPAGWRLATAGDLGLAVAPRRGGLAVESLCDLAHGREMLAAGSEPLWTMRLRHTGTTEEHSLAADAGWTRTRLAVEGGALVARWEVAAEPALAGVVVTASARPDRARHAWRWSLRVRAPAPWSVMGVAFPRVALAEPPRAPAVVYPHGPGVLRTDAWRSALAFRSLYPNGWCTMQWVAAYGADGGLYVARHDPLGGAKEIVVESEPQKRRLRIAFDEPAPDRTRAGNEFVLRGEGVWRLFRGDWFDAARIYREWVRSEARWWPRLGADGREDTPRWMRELCAWALASGAPEEHTEPVLRMREALGTPIGFHWYQWHQIPFDNDYPHYFPTRPGVAEGVARLQASGVHVMPYINGRLWDTRDRGAEDYAFTARALPAAAKQEDGKPFIESYGSKEADGSDVRLAPMCPTTPLWQSTVRDIVLRLMGEVGVHGVYIDQIAAAAPALCMDPSHNHPLGGGGWWTERGYWPMLEAIRAAMPADRILTTECNADPYIRWMDGYLTWHWQMEGMVPAFSAVYGGAIQMFGRSYGAGASTRDLALCTKMGQQLVFGEQIGWLDPRIALEPVAGAFLRETVRMRRHFVRYFYAGEMARPPIIAGSPKARSDWQWYGETWVTTDAVLGGAWALPRERRLLLLLTNVTAEAATVGLRLPTSSWGLPVSGVRWARLDAADAEAAPGAPPARVRLPARSVVAWEARW